VAVDGPDGGEYVWRNARNGERDFQSTYGWADEMILKGALHSCRVMEVPVSYYPQIGKVQV
jgi:hypothetical protein